MTRPPRSPRRIVIGLTGPIAAGKSTVAAMLRQHGAEVIDADDVYRSLLTPDSELTAQLVARFGPAILRPDGQVDRAALADMVFADAAALRDLDQITHPAVVAEVRRRIARSPAPVVVVEAIKLLQSGMRDDVDELWVVDAPSETRLRRLKSRAHLDRETAEQRLAAAADPLLRGANADVVVDTSGAIAETARAVASAWEDLEIASKSGRSDITHVVASQKEEL
jgi:dephospho-CoA kinase